MSQIPTASTAGIVESETGERHIPSSTRADGTKRKEIKIRPGYKPAEDVEVYKNRCAESWKGRESGKVPGAEGLEKVKSNVSTASHKNAKKRDARKKSKVTGERAKEEEQEQTEEAIKAIDPEVEREKRVRNLKKKLKQARDLKEKRDGGSNLLPDQLAKIIRINELIRELNSLNLDSNEEVMPTTKNEEEQKHKT